MQNYYVLPSKALLRCVFELITKLFWCLNVPDKTNDEKSDIIIKEKIRRWEKDTLCRNIEILEKFKDTINATQKKEIENEISRLKKETLFAYTTIKRLPKFADLIGQLPALFKKAFYGRLYLQCNNAIHLDVTSLTRKPSVYDSTNLTKYYVLLSYYVNWAVRKHFDLGIKQIKKDYDIIMDNLKIL